MILIQTDIASVSYGGDMMMIAEWNGIKWISQ